MKKFFFNSRGQFFSPDLVMATGVFIICLGLFFFASNSIFANVALQEAQKEADEVARGTINLLVYTSGQPSDWHLRTLSDTNFIGLVDSVNVLYKQKVFSLLNHLNDDTNYSIVKQKLGVGKYGFFFRLVDLSGATYSDGGVDISGGEIVSNPKLKLVYRRIVSYDGEQVLFEATLSLSE